MADSGLFIVISGFSGSGKGTIMKELIRRYPEKYALSISATTRQPREGEQDGREYFFKTKEEFLSMIEHNDTKGICTATASGTQACNSGNRDSGCVKDQRTVSTDPVVICDAAIC